MILLTIYQGFEFAICNLNFDYSFTIYFAFVDITLLPPTMLLLVFELWKSRSKSLYGIYIPSIFFSIFYLFNVNEFIVTKCSVIYASYNYPLGNLYGFFYYTPILISIAFLFKKMTTEKNTLRTYLSKLLLSGLIFISIPVIVSFIFYWSGNPKFLEALESIMCKFAFVLALCLFIFVRKNSKT